LGDDHSGDLLASYANRLSRGDPEAQVQAALDWCAWEEMPKIGQVW
jgi:hypothetical protein